MRVLDFKCERPDAPRRGFARLTAEVGMLWWKRRVTFVRSGCMWFEYDPVDDSLRHSHRSDLESVLSDAQNAENARESAREALSKIREKFPDLGAVIEPDPWNVQTEIDAMQLRIVDLEDENARLKARIADLEGYRGRVVS